MSRQLPEKISLRKRGFNGTRITPEKTIQTTRSNIVPLNPGERMDVTVIGRFYGTRDINNMGSGKYQLRVLRVEKVSDLED